MQIDKSTRMFKLFSWCIRLLIAVNDGEPLRRDYLKDGTDLCHFMRTILVTMPVVIMLQVLAFTIPVIALFVMPYYWFESKGVFVSASIMAGTFILIVSVAFIKDLKDRLSWHEPSPTEPTFKNLVTAYIMAKKSKICPLIHWKESK